jgi:3'(2'), 5'-bisphosphate nucleotidase
VLEEAGGHLTDIDMQPLRYNTKDSVLNPEFFAFGKTKVTWDRYLRTRQSKQ